MNESGRPSVFMDARKVADFGIGRYVAGLLRGLSARDEFDVSALVGPEGVSLLPPGVRPLLSQAGHYSLRELIAVRSAFSSSRAALFHAPHYVVPMGPPELTIVTIHDLMHLTRPEHASIAKRLYARTMIGRAVRAARKIICVSNSVARDLQISFPVASGKVAVIPNGVDDRFLQPVEEADRERVINRFGLKLPFLLFLGNDKPHKNLEGLLDAFALVKARREGKSAGPPPLHLVLAGTSAQGRQVRAMSVARRGIDEEVADLGFVPDADIPPLLALASALVLPSLDEGFGIPVLEAQAAGTPVICSNRGGLPEAAGEAALIVEPNPEELAEAIERLMDHPETARRLSDEGRARARKFTWPIVAERTAAVYREVFATHSVSRPPRGATETGRRT